MTPEGEAREEASLPVITDLVSEVPDSHCHHNLSCKTERVSAYGGCGVVEVGWGRGITLAPTFEEENLRDVKTTVS